VFFRAKGTALLQPRVKQHEPRECCATLGYEFF
jgi:hypothetical protein